MKNIPFLIRISLTLVTCVFIAKWTHVTFISFILHFAFYIGCCFAYLAWSWVHLALEKLWYERVHPLFAKNTSKTNQELE